MKGIDAIIFDLGNVLLAFDERRATEGLAARTGKARGQIEDYARNTPYVTELGLGKLSKQRFFQTVARDLGFDGTYEEFALLWSDIFTPIDPMIALAESLKGRTPRFVLSNTNAIHIEFILEHHPFMSGFDGLVFSHEVGMLKPDPAIFQYTLDKYGLAAGRTVYFDDITVYVEAARRLGIQAIHYRDFGQARAELTKLGVSPI